MQLKDQEDLCRVGPGTGMGNLMRQYWLPAAMSSELERDGTPMRLMLLGEKLIAFRDSSGRVGILDHRCPHRCASLFLGRNEEDGIRCTYHGWKFDVDGNCLDQPNVPEDRRFVERVKARAYKVQERNGLVWVYMGDRRPPPNLPMIEAALLPESEVEISFTLRSCNWLQTMEGDLDTSHVGFLHYGLLDPETVPAGHGLENVTERAPEFGVQEMPWGLHYTSHRKASEAGKTYWRNANFMFPCWTQTPQGEFGSNINARAWVPVDDEHTMLVYLRWKKRKGTLAPLKDGKLPAGSTPAPERLPNTTDWLGRWRLKGNAGNDWLIDRGLQKTGGVYSGITSLDLQDQAITESIGPLSDLGAEHLSTADVMIARTRKRLLAAVRGFRDKQESPPGADTPDIFYSVRAGFFVADSSEPVQALLARQELQADRPVKLSTEHAK